MKKPILLSIFLIYLSPQIAWVLTNPAVIPVSSLIDINTRPENNIHSSIDKRNSIENHISINNYDNRYNPTDFLPILNPVNKSGKVSFNFQNIDLRALLQLLSDFSGYNILVSDSVTGNISIKLNNVPWTQALDTILETKGLGIKHMGNILRIAPIAELLALNKQQQDSQNMQEKLEPLNTLTIHLKYAQAASIQNMILQKSVVVNSTVSTSNSHNIDQSASLLSDRGTVLVDPRTNTIIANDTTEHLQEIDNLINKVDIPVKQVLIEARIVEAKSLFEKDLGTRLLLAGVTNNLTYANSLENGVTIKQQGINLLGNGSSASDGVGNGTNNLVNQSFATMPNAASLATIFSPNSSNLIGLEIDALEQQSQGRTISSPKIMTANYQTANIQQGVQIPYQQASSAGNTNVAFVNATLSLQVTPQITEDNFILLNINLQKDSPSNTLVVQGTPAIDTSSINTQVRMQDGATVLVGGVYVDSNQKTLNEIPWLGDIPYIGWLFKAVTNKNTKNELLIFITPRIIGDGLENVN